MLMLKNIVCIHVNCTKDVLTKVGQPLQQCCKTRIKSQVLSNITCTIPGYEDIIGKTPQLPECSDNITAANSFDVMFGTVKNFAPNIMKGKLFHFKCVFC
jgi:hypothetical protein